MKKLRLLGLFFGLVLVCPNVVWSQDCGAGDEVCCDEDAGGLFDPAGCLAIGATIYGINGSNGDPDCGTVDDPECATIPLDGGLSLLALAGGGLATVAMRRRRKEEEAAQGAV
jgi:hypothetical protein